MDWGALVEPWRLAPVAVTGLVVLVLRRRLPGWVLAAWGLLVAAVVMPGRST